MKMTPAICARIDGPQAICSRISKLYARITSATDASADRGHRVPARHGSILSAKLIAVGDLVGFANSGRLASGAGLGALVADTLASVRRIRPADATGGAVRREHGSLASTG